MPRLDFFLLRTRENELRKYADCYGVPYVNFVSTVVITSFVHRSWFSLQRKWVYRSFLALNNAHPSASVFARASRQSHCTKYHSRLAEAILRMISSCRSLRRPVTSRSRGMIGRRIAKAGCGSMWLLCVPLCELCFYCGDYFVRSSIVIQFAAQMGLSIVSCSQQRTPFRKVFARASRQSHCTK